MAWVYVVLIILGLGLSLQAYQQNQIEGIDLSSGSHYTQETKSVAADPYLMDHGQIARTDSLVDAFQRDGCKVTLVGDATIVYRGGNGSMLIVDTSKIVSTASVAYTTGDKVAILDISNFDGSDPYLNISRELRQKI